MNFNLVEMYNGLLRFNKHILNELAEGLKHLPNLDGVSKGDSLIIIGNGSTNGDHYELGYFNADGSNSSTYPAVYRGILNFFGDIWTFIRDVAIINRNANYNSVYLLKKGVNHSDITIDNIQDKCYFIGDQANTNNFITEFDFRFGPYFVPNKIGTNKKADYIWVKDSNKQDTDKVIRVLLLGGRANDGSRAGSGCFASDWVRSDSFATVGFFTTVKLD